MIAVVSLIGAFLGFQILVRILSISELLPDADYPLRKTTIAWAGKADFGHFQQFGNFFTYTLNFRKEVTYVDQADHPLP